jgi:hypothetical protein
MAKTCLHKAVKLALGACVSGGPGGIVAEDCPIVSLSLIWDNRTGGHH